MRRSQRLISLAVLVALSGALAGCSSMSNFDPLDLLDFLDSKKKLPGDRKPVFPEGVPGLQQGVPRELYKGAQQPDTGPAVASVPPVQEPQTGSGAGKGRGAKSKGRPAAVSVGPVQDAAPAADPDAGPPEEGSNGAVPPAPKKKIVRRRTTAPPPDAAPAPQAQSAQPATTPFPAPMPGGTFQR